LLNGEQYSGALLEDMRQKGWIVRKDPEKERSPWSLTTAGWSELTKRRGGQGQGAGWSNGETKLDQGAGESGNVHAFSRS
jgi:hypothetical protein